jgi:hypothetical protein
MNDKEKRIKELESRNSELAKEILLNESAIFETEKEISELDQDLLGHPSIQQQINNLRLLIERIKNKNELYKNEIYSNDLEIKKLK